MELKSSLPIKSYINEGLDYYYLTQACPCIDVLATPLHGDARLELAVVDFGPMLIMKRLNQGAAIEEYRFAEHLVAIQLPTSSGDNIDAFQCALGGAQHSPFLLPGAKAQWIVPDNTELYQLHIDGRWLTKVLGPSAMEDYFELSTVPSRKAYDKEALLLVATACEQALSQGLAANAKGMTLAVDVVESLIKDILLPCINAELIDVKPTPRQKILGKALDYIHAHYAQPISLDGLADVTATSVRNLQLVFKHELGISPGSYIQQFRLHRFRHMLSTASSVTEAAYACGIKHLGRLTERYAQVFKQKPSSHLSSPRPQPLEMGDPHSLHWMVS
ncbi:hypothetical protein NBRC116188_23610 [Oceaniserpentilla sp. 4NH20-0058]|uniref:AraC family transcriptional regulator n=1 Tax=Oceaniserpentilla sp. 4NH20-0058 TaxID=3127660 RepID=UPI00310B1ABF